MMAKLKVFVGSLWSNKALDYIESFMYNEKKQKQKMGNILMVLICINFIFTKSLNAKKIYFRVINI